MTENKSQEVSLSLWPHLATCGVVRTDKTVRKAAPGHARLNTLLTPT